MLSVRYETNVMLHRQPILFSDVYNQLQKKKTVSQ